MDSTSRSGKGKESRINKQAASDESNFRALVNRRIRVSWNKDRSYFDGTITEFDTVIVNGP